MDGLLRNRDTQVSRDEVGVFKHQQKPQVEGEPQDEEKFGESHRPDPVDPDGQEIVDQYRDEQEQQVLPFSPGVEKKADHDQERVVGLVS